MPSREPASFSSGLRLLPLVAKSDGWSLICHAAGKAANDAQVSERGTRVRSAANAVRGGREYSTARTDKDGVTHDAKPALGSNDRPSSMCQNAQLKFIFQFEREWDLMRCVCTCSTACPQPESTDAMSRDAERVLYTTYSTGHYVNL